MSVYEARLLIL